ncbi:MAG TPA: PRC-barrel domain-containing protein [Falsiroseomonas sp.]|jgi:sporulation protein YlmC with PRC-barrel domain|nr:PRC-barrel domain-containing protein [Falsiroseomonas sp.]
MTIRQTLMAAVALCAAPTLALGQYNTGGSSMQPQTTQTTPNRLPVAGAPAARDAATQGTQITPGPGGVIAPGAALPEPTMTQMERIQQNPANTTGADALPPDPAPLGSPGGIAPRAAGNPGHLATSGGSVTGTPPVIGRPGQAMTGAPVPAAGMPAGRRASRLIGATVYNENNESIGEVDDIIVPPGGHPPVAILSVGGFLGIGARLVAVPYDRLRQDPARDRWVLQGATRDSLQSLPPYAYEADSRRG